MSTKLTANPLWACQWPRLVVAWESEKDQSDLSKVVSCSLGESECKGYREYEQRMPGSKAKKAAIGAPQGPGSGANYEQAFDSER